MQVEGAPGASWAPGITILESDKWIAIRISNVSFAWRDRSKEAGVRVAAPQHGGSSVRD